MGGGVDISLPNVSYCEDVKDIHYNPYNTVEFYVGNITGTTPQTVKIYTDLNTSVDVQVSKGNKWYTYVLPKDKGLCMIEGDSVKKVVVKADINPNIARIIPSSTIEASFKGSNTSKVTNMSAMFKNCSGLKLLDVSSFDTSKVAWMGNTFNGCSSLTSLDVSNFDTSNVTSMVNMFNGCSGLISLDLRNFDTSNVTDMSYMFENCSGLTSLTLSNFNTSKVTNMYGIFNGCRGLTSLDLSGWDISNETDMRNMFKNCTSLTSLDLSGWDTSSYRIVMSGMFSGCSKLKTITMKGCTTETRTKIEEELTDAGIKDNVTIVTE